jgi:protein-L-isoaspartate O-methyltransferase
MMDVFYGEFETSEAADSSGHPMAVKSVFELFGIIGLKKGDTVLEIGYGNYPRLAIYAAIVTQKVVVATDFPRKIYCLV